DRHEQVLEVGEVLEDRTYGKSRLRGDRGCGRLEVATVEESDGRVDDRFARLDRARSSPVDGNDRRSTRRTHEVPIFHLAPNVRIVFFSGVSYAARQPGQRHTCGTARRSVRVPSALPTW